MEAIAFKAGPQVAGTEVIDSSGVHWTVLKSIGYATAQPREGQYYTRVMEPIATVADLVIDAELHNDDFFFEEEIQPDGIVKLKLRIRR